jgi:hypothetical protein
MRANGYHRKSELDLNCINCDQRFGVHGSWPYLQCPIIEQPSDQRIKLLCDALQWCVRRLRDEPTLENMKAVVDACNRINEIAFTAAILRDKKLKDTVAVQVTNKRVSWLTQAAVTEHLATHIQQASEVPCPPTS